MQITKRKRDETENQIQGLLGTGRRELWRQKDMQLETGHATNTIRDTHSLPTWYPQR
jgi:hypothetical protein